MLVGYARVSTEDQGLTGQHSALKDIGCKRIYEEKVSGARRSRPVAVHRCCVFESACVVS